MAEAEPELLRIEGLHVVTGGREVLRGLDLTLPQGQTHVLLGPNGSGKTTLLNTIMGMPGYRITAGVVSFKGNDLVDLDVDERARLGIGLAFQRPPAVRGIRLRQLMTMAAGDVAKDLTRDTAPDDAATHRATTTLIAGLSDELDLEAMLDRDVNMGFSGGETKRSEIAQLVAQAPDLALFDEPESGVDLENIAVVGAAMNRLLKADRVTGSERSGLIVTHTGHILQYVNADVGHVLYEGRIACSGNARDLIGEIGKHGYERCVECMLCRP